MMKVKVIREFFDLSIKKPRHVGEVLTLSNKSYTTLLSADLVELVLDKKLPNNSSLKKKKDDKKDNQKNDKTDIQNDDKTDIQNDDKTDIQNDDDNENKDENN